MKKFIMFVSVFCLVIGIGYADSNGKLLEIHWPVAKKSQSMTKKLPYPLGLVNKANEVKLPVYIPSAYIYQTNIQMVNDSNFYTITIPLSVATLFIAGDRTYQQNSDTDVKITTEEPSFIRAEGMVSVDFNRHGANYTLSIECEQPENDQRCVQSDFLQQVYGDLVMVGGQP